MKELLKGIIGLVIAFLYSLLIKQYPDFPLGVGQIIALILWIVGLLIGGWQAKLYFIKKAKKVRR